MKRDAKIASLPQPVREQVNRRLQNGEATAQIAAWLNNLPEARDLMAAEFAGATIKKTDLAGWKLGGYRNWEAQQEALEAAAQFGQDAAEIARADGGQLADHLALCLTARLAVALRHPPGDGEDAAGQLQRLSQFSADLVALRKGDQNAQWLRIEREKFEAVLNKFEEEEALRRKEIEKREYAKKHPGEFHISQETRERIEEMLRRL